MLAAFEVTNSLINLLANSANGQYKVSGVRNRKTDANDVLRIPQVTVYYKSGQFQRNNSGVSGPYHHEAVLTVSILAAAVSELDLSVIAEYGDPDRIAAALAAKQDAEAIADYLADETASLLFDIIMRPQNRTLGMKDDPNRWITEYSKGEPAAIGAVVVLASSFTLTLQVPEYTSEENGIPGTSVRNDFYTTSNSGDNFENDETVHAAASKGSKV